MQKSNRRLDSITGCTRTDFFANAGFVCGEIFATLLPITVRNRESDLRVEHLLARALHRQELPGLAFQFFNSSASCFGDWSKKGDAHPFQSERLQPQRKGNGRNSGCRGNAEMLRCGRNFRFPQLVEFREPGVDRKILRLHSARKIDDYRSRCQRGLKVAIDEFRRTCKKHEPRLLETTFLHRLNPRGFSTGFRQSSRGHFFIHQPQIPSGELALFQ